MNECSCCHLRRGLPGHQGLSLPGAIGPQGVTGEEGTPGSIPSPIGALSYGINGTVILGNTWSTMTLQVPAFNYGMTASGVGFTVPSDGLYAINWTVAISGLSPFFSIVVVDTVQVASMTTNHVANVYPFNSLSGATVQRISSGQSVSVLVYYSQSSSTTIISSLTAGHQHFNMLSSLSIVKVSE